MSEYTPGPWYGDMFGNVTTHPPRTGLRMLLPTNGIVAKAYKNEEANARLIASAPALLEALRPFAEFMPSADAPCHVGICPQEKCGHCSRIAAARAAIKNAEGSK